MLKKWNLALILGAFVLSIFGTFITRSGVIASVHSFTQSNVGYYFLVFLILITVGSAVLYVNRLPLLEAETSRWVSHTDFLAGYGVAQALPGPLFSFAAYLGAAVFALMLACGAAIFVWDRPLAVAGRVVERVAAATIRRKRPPTGLAERLLAERDVVMSAWVAKRPRGLCCRDSRDRQASALCGCVLRQGDGQRRRRGAAREPVAAVERNTRRDVIGG